MAESEVAAGKFRGPLHGIPIGVKDIINTKRILTTEGSSFFLSNFADEDADCVRRLRDAGTIIIGKCNTGEFAAESSTKILITVLVTILGILAMFRRDQVVGLLQQLRHI